MRPIKVKTMQIHAIISLFVVLINSGYALTTGNYSLARNIGIIYIIYSVLVLRSLKKDSSLMILGGIILFMMLSIIAGKDSNGVMEASRVLIIILCAYCATRIFSVEEIIRLFCNIMTVCAIASLVFFALVNMLPGLPFPIVSDGRGIEYYTCFISSVQVKSVLRNSGLFWEGGMLSAFCALWLIFEVIYMDREKKYLFLVLLVGFATIITTKSTTGYLYILLIILLILSKVGFAQKKMIYQVIFLAGTAALIFFFYNFYDYLEALVEFNEVVFRKVLTQNVSFTDRINGPQADIILALKHPLGVGFTYLTDMVNQVSLSYFGKILTARTSTLTYFFPAFGILGGILVNIQWVRFFVGSIKSLMLRIMACILFVILCTSTPLYANCFFWIIIFFGVSSNLSIQQNAKEN